MRQFAKLFEKVDVIVTPSTDEQLIATNLTGNPAVILPNGLRGADAPAPPPVDDGNHDNIGGPGNAGFDYFPRRALPGREAGGFFARLPAGDRVPEAAPEARLAGEPLVEAFEDPLLETFVEPFEETFEDPFVEAFELSPLATVCLARLRVNESMLLVAGGTVRVGARGGVDGDGFDRNGRRAESDAQESELRVAIAVKGDGVACSIGFLSAGLRPAFVPAGSSSILRGRSSRHCLQRCRGSGGHRFS